MTYVYVLIAVVVVVLAVAFGSKKPTQIPLPKPEPKPEVCGELATLKVIYKGEYLKVNEVALIPTGEIAVFEAEGFDLKGKEACFDENKLFWYISCPTPVWTFPNGLSNGILMETKDKEADTWIKYGSIVFKFKIKSV
jgi:hypothetical protein